MQERENEVRLVAVMGQTGAGKSSFVNSVLGRKVALTSDEIFSCTKIVEHFTYEPREGLTVALIDVPGFNHSTAEGSDLTDEDILQLVADFLESKYDGQKKLSGIVFLHRINGDPESGPIRNTRHLQKLCLNNELGDVVVVTTHWDQVCFDQSTLRDAEEKERALKSDGHPKLFNDAGARFLRTGHFDNDSDVPQHLRAQFQPPATIVESLLGLESNCPENHEQAESELSLEPSSLENHEQAQSESDEETKTDLAVLQDIVQPTLNERMDRINKTVEDLRDQFSSQMKAQENCQQVPEGQQDQSPKGIISSELLEVQAKLNDQGSRPTHEPKEFEPLEEEGLNDRIDSIQKSVEKSQTQFFIRWKAWEDHQKSLTATQLEELRNIHSEMLNVKEVLQSLAVELKTESKTSRKERDELSIERLTLRARERELLLSWKLQEVQDENAKLVQQLSAKQSTQMKAVEAVRAERIKEAVITSGNLLRQLQELGSLKGDSEESESQVSLLKAELKKKDDELAERNRRISSLEAKMFSVRKALGEHGPADSEVQHAPSPPLWEASARAPASARD